MLTRRPRPIWIYCPEKTSTADILALVSKLEAVTKYKEVTVISKTGYTSEVVRFAGKRMASKVVNGLRFMAASTRPA